MDLIHVYDGPSDKDPLLDILTGNRRNSFNSSGRYMTITFSSYDSMAYKGFRAEWKYLGMFQYHLYQFSNNCVCL